MRLPKFRYTVLAAVIFGILIPLLAMAGFQLRVFPTPAGYWLLCVWPSSIMLMATENLGHSPQAFAILAWSIAWNVLLYLIFFTLIWSVAWVLRYVHGAHHCVMARRSNQSMKPTAPLHSKLSLFATTPCRGLSLSR